MFINAESHDLVGTGQSAIIERFEAHIRDRAFPCVGAKSALARGTMTFLVAGDLRCPGHDRAIFALLTDFARAFAASPRPFQSLVVLFDTPGTMDEAAFEAAMWSRLQALEEMDAACGHTYDRRVSPDVDSPQFSLSFAGEAFFVVGMHPGASRPARRFGTPALVFNAHDQFETLRLQGRYETLRDSIIARDIATAGSVNPMLARHGERSEAIQYSGRAADEGWVCPFHRVHAG